MPPKSKSNRSRPAKKRIKTGAASAKPPEVEPLSPAAMENLYYICHNAADFLEFRGFGWPKTKKKTKKKKGKKRQKKK